MHRLRSHILELEAEIRQWREQADALTEENEAVKTEARLLMEQLQSKDEQLSTMSTLPNLAVEEPTIAPVLDRKQLYLERDRILASLKVGKQSPKYKEFQQTLTQFIKAISQ